MYQAGSTNVLGASCPVFTPVDGLEELKVKQVGQRLTGFNSRNDWRADSPGLALGKACFTPSLLAQ